MAKEGTEYKLTYFDATGRAEIIRWLFHMAQVPFEDIRLPGKEWLALKPQTPMLKLPILQVNEKTYCQSKAIARYLAKEFGFAGKTPQEVIQCDMIVGCCEDMGDNARDIFYNAKEPEVRADRKLKYERDFLPQCFNFLEKLAFGDDNDKDCDWLVGDDVTWADLVFTVTTTCWMAPLQVKLPWKDHPRLQRIRDNTLANPRIAEWIEMRPQTLL